MTDIVDKLNEHINLGPAEAIRFPRTQMKKLLNEATKAILELRLSLSQLSNVVDRQVVLIEKQEQEIERLRADLAILHTAALTLATDSFPDSPNAVLQSYVAEAERKMKEN